ncbi:hypothetical protein [Streptomyces sp. NPDC006335]|uniref:hypothetical protein n=1 Tax=Streptomyces sp. NPDC006335 TaxID=3156895 RepID=UPI0033AE6224
MNGEQHDSNEQPATDPWVPVTVSAEESEQHPQMLAAYEQTLTAAGYGEDQRERYIQQSGLDPEEAALVWDNEIVPAAEAADAIPEHPGYFDPVERATLDARDAAIDEFWKQHPEYDVWSNSPENQALFRQAMGYGDAKAREVLGDQAAEHLMSAPKATTADQDIEEDDIDL